MYLGIFFRKKRSRHVPIMRTAIIWDLLLVLQIELNRSAVAKALEVEQNSLLLNFHVTIAVAVLVLYGFLLYFGAQLLRGRAQFRMWHKMCGWTAVVLRTLILITSYMIDTASN